MGSRPAVGTLSKSFTIRKCPAMLQHLRHRGMNCTSELCVEQGCSPIKEVGGRKKEGGPLYCRKNTAKNSPRVKFYGYKYRIFSHGRPK